MNSIELKVVCKNCERELSSEVIYRTFEVELIIEPCENCLDFEKEAGFEDGYSNGNNNGYAEGKAEAETAA